MFPSINVKNAYRWKNKIERRTVKANEANRMISETHVRSMDYGKCSILKELRRDHASMEYKMAGKWQVKGLRATNRIDEGMKRR